MPGAEKKPLTEREKRRLRANQIAKTVTLERNENTQTNLTYKKIIDRITSEDKKKTRVSDKIDDDKEGDEPLEGDDMISDGEVAADEKEDASTDASQDSDSSSSAGDSQKQHLRNEFLFSGSGTFIKQWTNFVIILAMYNSVLIPLQIFYKDELPSALKSTNISLIDALVDLFFLIDIIFTFRTTFLDPKQSIEIKDPHVIGRRYLRGNFAIDLISSVPWNALFRVGEAGPLSFILDALGLLKLLRLSRLYTTVQRSNLAQDIKVYLKVVMMAIFLLVFMHVLSCIWFFIVLQQERWVQNMDFMYVQQEQAYQGFLEGDEAFWRKYLVLLYTGFYIFGVGEVVPRADSMEFFSGFVLCSLCTIFNAVIIGYMTSYMEELSKKTAELNEKLNLTNTAMLNLNLSRGLKTQITQYIYQTHTTKQLQSELTNFMNQISPVYKRKVTKESFKELVVKNTILRQIKDTYMQQRRKAINARSYTPSKAKLFEQKEHDKCITQLVVKLESIFTSPDMLYLQQEDESWKNPNTAVDDEGGVSNDSEESFMYFIRNGKFSVHVKTEHLKPVADDSEKPQPVTHLIDGDHFGEIGLIFESKRSATVRSENYGTLAMLKKSHFLELSKTFDSLTTLFKHQIFKYQDELTMWLMIEMDKIPYFRQLSLLTKQELIYSMDRLTFEKGSLICKKDVIADKLILIQQGIVEVAVKYDRRRDDQYFVIERLGRGGIINHRSFLIADDADTDFVCRTTVSCFVLYFDKFKQVEAKRQDLQQAIKYVEQELYAPLLPLALDYIFHNNVKDSHGAYVETLRKNELRVKFKNAIMQQWTKVKDDTAPGNIQDMVDQMLKKKRDSAKDGGDYAQQKQAQEALVAKLERRRERASKKQQDLETEAKDSYLNIEQFQFLQKNIEQAGKRLKEQQTYIDQMEKKMIAQLENRRKKESGENDAPDKESGNRSGAQFLHA